MKKLVKKIGIRTIVFIVLLGFLAVLIANQMELPMADDLPRHLKNGELILSGNFDVLYNNYYSYTMPEATFINHHWLSGVIFFILHNAIGWSGLSIFKILVFLATFTLLFLTAQKKSNFWLAALFSIPSIIIFADRGALRPEIFSYLFISVFLYVLVIWEEDPVSKKIFWLIPLQVLWVNMHLFFIVGPAIIAGLLLEKVIHNRKDLKDNLIIKRLGALLSAAIVACLFNPNFIRGALYPLNIFRNYGMDVNENQSLVSFMRFELFQYNLSVVFFLVSIAVFVMLVILNIKRRPLPVFYILGGLTAGIAGFLVIRLSAFFAIIFLPASTVLAHYFWQKVSQRIPKYFWTKLPAIFAVCVIIFTSFIAYSKITGATFDYYRTGIGLSEHSEDVEEFWTENDIKGPIFNDYDIGSYVLYYMPQEKVFVDNRPEAYSSAFFEDTYLKIFTDEDFWRKMDAEHKFNALILSRYSNIMGFYEFSYSRVSDPAWALVYADPYAVIFLKRNEENKNIIQEHEITSQNIEARMSYLLNSREMADQVNAADNFNLVGRDDLGMRTFFNVVERWPKKGKIWMVMGEWELDNQNPKSPLLSIMYLQKALAVGYKTAEVYTFLGSAYSRIGYFEKAKEMLREALDINPDRADAKELLNILESQTIQIQ